jgi:hypothetical protein
MAMPNAMMVSAAKERGQAEANFRLSIHNRGWSNINRLNVCVNNRLRGDVNRLWAYTNRLRRYDNRLRRNNNRLRRNVNRLVSRGKSNTYTDSAAAISRY